MGTLYRFSVGNVTSFDWCSPIGCGRTLSEDETTDRRSPDPRETRTGVDRGPVREAVVDPIGT